MREKGTLALHPLEIVFILLIFVISGLYTYSQILRCEAYARVYETPVRVYANVYRHDSYYDSDDGTRYTSYICYEVDGVLYADIKYQDASSKEKLLPLHKRILVEVNPENHGELMRDVVKPFLLFIPAPIMSLTCILALRSSLRNSRLARYYGAGITMERATHDLHIVIRGRLPRLCWLIVWVYAAFLLIRYPMVFGKGYHIFCLVAILFWIYCMFTTIRDTLRVNRGEFHIQHDLLTRKEESTDSDGDPVYILHYSGGDKTWRKNVSRKVFMEQAEGTIVHALYISGQNRPTLYYDGNGAAHL